MRLSGGICPLRFLERKKLNAYRKRFEPLPFYSGTYSITDMITSGRPRKIKSHGHYSIMVR